MPPTPGVLSDVEESILDLTGPSSSFSHEFSLDSNIRSSSRNTSISGPTASSSVPVQTPSPSDSSRYAPRRHNGSSGGGKGLDSPLQTPARVTARGILSVDDSIYPTSGAHATPKRSLRARPDSSSDTPATVVKADRKPAKRSNAMMTLREHERVIAGSLRRAISFTQLTEYSSSCDLGG